MMAAICEENTVSLTTVLAVYGSLVSTAAVFWNIYSSLQDRAKLKVRLSLKRIVTRSDGRPFAIAPDHAAAGNGKVLGYVSITNIGRRPVNVTGVGAVRDDGQRLQVSQDILPKILNEGESTFEVIHDLVAEAGRLKQLFAYDSAGKEWNTPKEDLNKVKKDAPQYAEDQV
jgi:hypothetical protein